MDKEMTLTRTFNAPREKAWRAWTDPTIVSKWWGPKGVTNPVCEIEPRAGGKINIVMVAGETLGELKGQKWPMAGFFNEVNEPEKISFTSEAIVDGRPIFKSLTDVSFENIDGKTKVTVHESVKNASPEAKEPLRGMETGWNQSLDKLQKLLES